MHNQLQEFWDNCNPNFAHIDISGHLVSLESLTHKWEVAFISEYDFNNKTIIDYGIGGGYLGLYLFKNKNLGKYIGFDISNRQLGVAKNNLKGTNFELYNALEDYDFSVHNADIFISQATIQHFPDEDYLVKFLGKLNQSKIPQIMLQIRYNQNTIFGNDYTQKRNVCLACHTNKEFVGEHLTNYSLEQNKQTSGKSNYQFLFFTQK